MPSPGGQVSGMWARAGGLRQEWGAVRCHPDDLPEGYQTAARGQARRGRPGVVRRGAPALRPGRAAPGRRDGTSD